MGAESGKLQFNTSGTLYDTSDLGSKSRINK
jgi:hypothetical protein